MTNPRARRAITIATIALVVVAAVAVGFALLNNASPTTPEPRVGPSASLSAAPSPSYSPTDQYGSPEPGLQAGPVRAGEGGTTRGPAGLPLGYQHDETGAVSAATNYLIWMNSLRIADKPTADAMAAAAAADAATRQALTTSFDQVRSGLSGLTADQPEPTRGAYAVAESGPDKVLVYIWAPEVTTDREGQTESLWAIDAVEVTWSDGDWKLNTTLIARTGAAAVELADPDGNPSAAEKHSILTRTPADPGEITDSAEQTWFEYANAPH